MGCHAMVGHLVFRYTYGCGHGGRCFGSRQMSCFGVLDEVVKVHGEGQSNPSIINGFQRGDS